LSELSLLKGLLGHPPNNQINLEACVRIRTLWKAVVASLPIPPSRLFLGHWLLIGIRGEEFAKSRVLCMAFLLIDNHEAGTQLGLKQKQKLVHIAIEAVAPGLRPEAWIRWIQWVEVAKIFLIETVDERVNLAWQ
jgi:hypothetical protein